MVRFLLLLVSGTWLCSTLHGQAQVSADFETVVFQSGQADYHTLRIPAVLQTSNNTLLAFAEGRLGGQGDSGNIDLVLRRSKDGGRTWSPLQVIWDDGANTCGNPCPVVDATTGRIWLAMTWNLGSDHEGEILKGKSQFPRRVFMTFSDDDGMTWAKPLEISDSARLADWRWYATGPGNGIQLTQGCYQGRLIIPCNHSSGLLGVDSRSYRSHVLYSDDQGASWRLGGVQEILTNESAIVELEGGRVMQNMRSYHGQNNRAVAVSSDGGEHFGPLFLEAQQFSPVCQASLIRLRWASDITPGILVFSSPDSRGRDHMTLRFSFDDGVSWPSKHLVYSGSSAYSALVKLNEAQIGLLYERDRYQSIVFTSLSLRDSVQPQ